MACVYSVYHNHTQQNKSVLVPGVMSLKKKIFEEYVPAASLVVYGKQKGYPIHIGMPFVIQKIIRAFRPYLHVFAIMVGGLNFANFGTASTTEKESCGRNRHPGREVNTFFSYSNIF